MCLKYIYWISPRVKDFHWAWNVIFASAVASQATCAVLVGRGTVQPDVSCGLTHQWACLFSGFVCKDTFSAFTNVFNCSYFSNVLKETNLPQIFWTNYSFRNVCAIFFLRGSSYSDQWCPWCHPIADSSSTFWSAEYYSERDPTCNTAEQH